MAVAQLVEWSLPTPEVYGSNTVIGKVYITYVLSTVLNRQKYRKEAGNGPFNKQLVRYF